MEHYGVHAAPETGLIRELASQGRIVFTVHALRQAMKRSIILDDIRGGMAEFAKVIRHYPHDAKGYSCLVRCYTGLGDRLHCVCAVVRREPTTTREMDVVVITVYRPSTTDDMMFKS